MRVSDANFLQTFLNGLGNQREALDRSLKSLVDGKRVRQSSDDPSGARTAMELRARFVRLEGYERAGASAKYGLDDIEAALGEVFDDLIEARDKAVEGASETNETNRPLLANQVDDIRERILNAANTRRDGRYLFGGTSTLATPFDTVGSYSGNDGESRAPLDDRQTVSTTLSGRRVFQDGGDVLATLSDLSTALRNNDTAAIQNLLPALEGQLDHINEVRAEVGSRLQNIERFAANRASERVRIQERVIEIENVSREQSALEINQANNSIEALSATASRVLGRSLFDFLG